MSVNLYRRKTRILDPLIVRIIFAYNIHYVARLFVRIQTAELQRLL